MDVKLFVAGSCGPPAGPDEEIPAAAISALTSPLTGSAYICKSCFDNCSEPPDRNSSELMGLVGSPAADDTFSISIRSSASSVLQTVPSSVFTAMLLLNRFGLCLGRGVHEFKSLLPEIK